MALLIIIIFIFLSFIALFSFIEAKTFPIKNMIIFLLGMLLILLSTFRTPFFDRDYILYNYMFYGNSETETKEPSFKFLVFFVKNILNQNLTFLLFIYAVLGVGTKMYAIKKYSKLPILSILLYFSYLYLLQDLTQIRVGVATGFILLSIKPLNERNFKSFLFFYLAAFLFHYSAFFVIFFWFIDCKKINKYIYFIIIPLSYLSTFALADLLTSAQSYLPSFIQFKLNAYDFETGSELNIYNAWQLMRISIAYFALCNLNKLKILSNYSILLLKLYILSIVTLAVLSFNPVYAGRISDMLSVFDIIFIPMVFSIFKPRLVGRIAVIIICLAYFYLNFFYIGIFKN